MAERDPPARSRRAVLRRGAVAAGVVATGSGALAGCLGGHPESVTVEMTDDLTYEPRDVTVAVGGTVTWVTVGSVPHTVTAYRDELPAGATFFASGGFDSEAAARDEVRAGYVREGERYTHRFETPGRHGYFCVPHEGAGMTGTVTVK